MKKRIIISLVAIGLTTGCGKKEAKPTEQEPTPGDAATVVDPGAWEDTGDPEAGSLV